MNESTATVTTNGTARRALGRGLEAIMGVDPSNDQPQTESVNTARAAFEIVAILEGVADRQVENIFYFVQAIRQTASGESVQELGEGLRQIERSRREREANGAQKRGWFRK